MKALRFLCLSGIVGMVLGIPALCGAATPESNDAQRKQLHKLIQQGNYKDAYDRLRKLALDPDDNPRLVGDDLNRATNCLQRLNRVNEIDAFREAVIEVHKDNWRLLWAAAQNYMSTQHQGYIVAGEFHRGRKRGGGRVVNAVERDRVRALQLMAQALPLARQDDNHAEVGNYLLSFASILLNHRGPGEAWRLQYLTDLNELPDYDPGWGHSRRAGGAPVDAEGNPVYHYTPETFEAAKTDGQRWRWCLEQAIEFNPRRKSAVRKQFADFLLNQFGVQTMARRGWVFGRMQTDDTKEDESGTYALHTLGENETIAQLATGIKRFTLPFAGPTSLTSSRSISRSPRSRTSATPWVRWTSWRRSSRTAASIPRRPATGK